MGQGDRELPHVRGALETRDAPGSCGVSEALHPAKESGLTMRDAVVQYEGGRSTTVLTAVDGIDLEVRKGEVLALLGPSGCGKSTLLRAVAGLEPLASGSLTWDGKDLAGVAVHRRGFGLMFQDGQLFAHRNVAGNVAYGISGLPREERGRRVGELLDVVGLAGYERRGIETLSGGERQRVALARALAPRPRLLLLDEPLSALDRGLRERLAADLRAILVKTGTTAVFVTHDHDEAFTVADRIAVMDAGRMLQIATPTELWRAPASRRVAEFLGYQAFVSVPEGWGSTAADTEAAETTQAAARELAIGPRGLVLTGAGPTAGSSTSWAGTAVAVGIRRGVAEVTVDVELPGTHRLSRVVALVGSPLRGNGPAHGEDLLGPLPRDGCALI